MTPKPAILFISSPDLSSELYQTTIKNEFEVVNYDFQSSNPQDFLNFLGDNFDVDSKPLTAIYGGFPSFHPIGGLTEALIEDKLFPKDTIKCIVLCSRGVNGIDIHALKRHSIKLFNYNDEPDSCSEKNRALKKAGVVGNDVADCVLWHILEGYRKLSYQQRHLRVTRNTLTSRLAAAGKSPDLKEFSFGHELVSCCAESPRDKKALILGLGGIGKQIALKLHHGLGMQVHYAKRTCDKEVPWFYHPLDASIHDKLSQFSTVVVALPGTTETKHLIDKKFLSYCSRDLVLVNIGRGWILEPDAIQSALKGGQIRHLGIDVFYNEPVVEEWLAEDTARVSITPHVGSGTKDNFYQSCEFALNNIIEVVLHNSNGYSRVV
ncbi:LAQU0S07e04434g1_1 [Lachancea quebecensis]|uniref:LAQU0S07e04434g1_1 n=1 Tax=Lachancea quebecensis TaxID=1654605 RepID=A0A0P1L1B9_9SACH|nr:LAQU0S07e04434g1_1 [Lachancea quebecensis]